MRHSFLIFILAVAWAGCAHAENDILIGAGVRSRPEFDGFSNRTTDLIPVLRYYGTPWFARTTQGMLEGGARWQVGEGTDIGAQLAYEQGPRDKDPGASIGVHAEWEGRLGPMPLDALLRLRQHTDTDRGLQVDLRLTAGVYEGHGVLAGVFAQATYGNEDYYRAFYEVESSCVVYASLGALASYDLSRHWLLVGSVERRRLTDNAARSPLVAQRSASYASAGLAYRF
jgi:outer membrane scaffolding protein for murein synthesis (MipA/OmpV family)